MYADYHIDYQEPVRFVDLKNSEDDWVLENLEGEKPFFSFKNSSWSGAKVFVPGNEWLASISFKTNHVGVKDAHEIKYRFDSGKFGFGGSYSHNPLALNAAEADSWRVGGYFKSTNMWGKDYGLYLGFRDAGRDAFSFDNFDVTGAHGLEFGAQYFFSNTIVGSVKAFKGLNSETNENVHAGSVELTFYF